jgi:hypothetical protein
LVSDRADRHEVGHFGDAFFREKTRQQNVRVREVKLPNTPVIELWLNLEAASTLVIEQGCEHRRRIEARVAEEIDGPVHSRKGNRPHIANHAVVLNGLKAHAGSVSPGWMSGTRRVTYETHAL